MPASAELLLMFAARAVHIENLIRPALAAGRWVICDRFTDATRAYQGAGRGADRHLIDTLARAVQRELVPDRVLLLDLPADVGLARARQRNAGLGQSAPDRFEAETLEFFVRVRAGYLDLAAADPGHFRVIDAMQSADRVATCAVDALRDLE